MANKVVLVGNLGAEPDLRYTAAGAAVCQLSLATSEKYKDRDGAQQEKTQWHRLVVWRQLAEVCGKYLKKGSKIYIEGKIEYRSYDDREGVKKYITEIVVDKMEMLDRTNSSGGEDRGREGFPRAEDNYQQNGQQQNTAGRDTGSHDEPPFNPDDDIPF